MIKVWMNYRDIITIEPDKMGGKRAFVGSV
jgi:uncharacterized protein (DUF433 family)